MPLTDKTAIRGFSAPARFQVPALPPAYVPRPDLVERLDRSAAPLTVVVGSVGAGKTALLSSWALARTESTVWLACDPSDADPVRFWSGLAEAVQRAAPDAGLDAQARLEDEGTESVEAAASLATDCGLLSNGALVVDDFHLAATSPPVTSAFIRYLPTDVRLVLASRRDPPFSLARLRVQGQVLEIRNRELGFDLDTARALFDRLRIDVDQQDLSRLCDLTEGWAAGLQLAALSLAGRDDASGFVQDFAATDRGVADFLVNEVLDQQPAGVAEFLMATSVLESFDAELCQAVTGRPDAGEVLQSLRDAHFFVVDHDQRNGWYRYHLLFRSFLRARLRAMSEGRFRAAHAAAAEALAERGDVMGAVDHAMSAEDVGRAFELVREVGVRELDFASRNTALDTVRAWLRQYGGRFVEVDPGLVLECCIVLNTLGAPDDITTWLRRAEGSAAIDTDPTCRARIAATWALHALQRGDPVAALERVDEALRLLGDRVGDDVWVSQWPNVSCPAHFVLDDTDAVRRDVGAGRAVSAKLTVLDSVRMPGYLAWAAAVDGELEEATRQARLALDAADALGMAQSNFGRVTPVLSLAVVAAEHDDLDEAARLTGQALEAAEWARRRTFLLFCVLQQAQLDRTLGEVPSALARLEQARRVLPDASPEVTDHIDRLDAAIAIEAGNPKAPALVEGLRPSPFRALLEARLLLRQGDARSAAALLDEHRGAMHNRRLHVEHGLLEARALAPRNRERALDTLAGVLRRAAPVGLLRTVIDAGADVHSLIEALPTDPQTAAFAAEVLAAVHRRPTVRRSAERDAVDTLSEREHDVLRFLASRLSYSEIAGELYISVNTLKSHVKAVYRKLGVSTRAEAVEAARRSGLL